MTTPEPPLSAPPASSQALPADRDTHPAVRAGQDAYMELLRTGDGCPGSHDVAAAVAPAVLLWAGQQFVAAAERHAASGHPERLAVASGKYAAAAMAATWADEIAAASSVPTGARDPAVRWWTHGSCGPAPGNADGPRWTSCVGCGKPASDLHWTPYPTPGNPSNGDGTDG